MALKQTQISSLEVLRLQFYIFIWYGTDNFINFVIVKSVWLWIGDML